MEIRSEADFEAWGETVSREKRVLAKSRLELRSLMVFINLNLSTAHHDSTFKHFISSFLADFRIYLHLCEPKKFKYKIATTPHFPIHNLIINEETHHKYWNEAQTDCNFLDDIEKISNLAKFAEHNIWRHGVPKFFSEALHSVESQILSFDQSWTIWTDWYRYRISNSRRSILLEKAMNGYIDSVNLSAIENSEFNLGLRLVFDTYYTSPITKRPSFRKPEQRTAILKAEWREGLVHRAATEPGVKDAAQAARLAAAWQALRDGVADLRLSHAGGNWPRLERALGRYDDALGEEFDALNVIAIGVHGEKIIGMAGAADDFLMADAAEELSAIARAHGPFIAQFEQWQAYLNDSQPEPSDAELALARDVARELAAQRALVAEDVAEPLNTLADDAEPEADPDKADKRELVNGVRNTLAALFGYVGGKLKRADEGFDDGIKAAMKVATVAAGTYLFAKLTALGSVSGGEFGWLSPWLAKLASLAGK